MSVNDPYLDGGLHVRAVSDPGTTRIVLSGEADFSVAHELQVALERMPDGAARTLQLDLGRLCFADADSVRALAAFAARARSSGLRVRTTGARPVVRKVAAVLGLCGDLGLS